jgi:hypothetical protein
VTFIANTFPRVTFIRMTFISEDSRNDSHRNDSSNNDIKRSLRVAFKIKKDTITFNMVHNHTYHNSNCDSVKANKP